MSRRNWSTLLYGIFVISYAVWKGNAAAISHTTFFNGKGEMVVPVAVRSMEEAAILGSARFYSDAQGIRQTDILELEQAQYNWLATGQVLGFGTALALLLLLIRFMIARLENKTQRQVR